MDQTKSPLKWMALSAVLLTGCFKVGPDYKAPDTQVAPEFKQASDPALQRGAVDLSKWWTVYNDALLSRLVETAAQDNLSLKSAAARIREARANIGIAVGAWFPEIDAQGQVLEQGTAPSSASNAGTPNTSSGAGFTLGWEIDLFGRISRQVESAEASYQSYQEGQRDILVSLLAEVAKNYFNMRALQAQITQAEANIDAQKGVLELTKTRFNNGLASGLDVSQAERVLASSEAELPSYRASLVQAINTIAILLGKNPGVYYEELSVVQPIPLPPPQIAVGIPADLLRQRPDIRKAERDLAAQTAQIGVARADLYPSFNLGGTFGYNYTSKGPGGVTSWNVGPTFDWRFLDFGRVRNQIKVEDARTEQALLQYEQTVLSALNETENALRAYVEQRARTAALERTLDASRRSLSLAVELYTQGLVDFQNVLDAQSAVFNYDAQLQQAKGLAVTDLALVYKAFGGGWNMTQLEPPVSAQTRIKEVAQQPFSATAE